MNNVLPDETPQVKKGPIVAVLLIGAFVAILNQTLLNVAIPEIMIALSISANTAQWILTGFMLVNGVLIPVTAFLIERFSTRKLYITAMGLFAVGTLICALAPFFSMLLMGRFVQAAGAAIMMPLMMNVILSIFPFDQRGRAMGFVGMCIMFAPAIGPSLSGWLLESYSWRSLFWVMLPISVICILIGIFFMKNVTKLTYPKIDVLSVILSTLGFGGILYAFSSAGDFGWTSIVVLLSFIIGGITLFMFVWRQFTLDTPMLDFRVFRYKMYSLTTIISVVLTMAMLSGMILIPIYMQSFREFSPLESGLLLLPGAVLMGAMSPVAGWIFDKIGAKWLAIVGLAITTVTTWQFSHLTNETTFTTLLTLNTVRMFGMSLLMMPVTTSGLNQLPRRLHAHGSAMTNTTRTIAGSLGIAFMVTLMTVRGKHHEQFMSDSAAAIQGVNDAFLVATYLSALALLLAFFITRVTPDKEDLVQQTSDET